MRLAGHDDEGRISDRTVSIPLSPALTDEDAADVVKALHAVLG